MYEIVEKKQQNKGRSRQLVMQRQFTPYTRADFGITDDPDIIAEVKRSREDHMDYTLSDGDNQGSIKHHIPYNWIMENFAQRFVIGRTKQNAIQTGVAIITHLGIPPDAAMARGFHSNNRVDQDVALERTAYAMCDWERNLFRHSASSGDGNGTLIDEPADPDVAARVHNAARYLKSLATPLTGGLAIQ